MAFHRDSTASTETAAAWDASYINNLPDSAFALIDPGGTKDEDGKTVPRALRHYPHHDASGAVDLPHLRNALARAAQNPDTGDKVLPHLKRHADAAGVGKDAPKEYDDAHDKEWQDGAIAPALLLQHHKLDYLIEEVVADQLAMTKLSIDIKAGRRVSNDKLSKLKEIIVHLQEVVDWAEQVDRGDDGKAMNDWYDLQAEILELELDQMEVA